MAKLSYLPVQVVKIETVFRWNEARKEPVILILMSGRRHARSFEKIQQVE